MCERERTPKAVPRHAHGLLLVVGKGLRIKKISPTAIFAKLAVSRLSAPPIPLCICSSALFCSCTSSLICTVIWRRAERHAGRLRQLLTRLCSSVHSSVDPICQMLRFNNTLIDTQHFGLAFHPRWMAETRLLSFAGNFQLWRLDVAKWSREVWVWACVHRHGPVVRDALTFFIAAIFACRLPRASSFCFSKTSAAAPCAPELAPPPAPPPPPRFHRSLILSLESSPHKTAPQSLQISSPMIGRRLPLNNSSFSPFSPSALSPDRQPPPGSWPRPT